MKISISANNGAAAVELLDADNFREFSVVASADLDAATLADGAAQVGRAEGDDHVFVDRAKLVALAGASAESEEWQKSFEGMVGYADSKGWVDADGAIRAHIERV